MARIVERTDPVSGTTGDIGTRFPNEPTMTGTEAANPNLAPNSSVPEFKPVAANTTPLAFGATKAGDTSGFKPAQEGISLMDAATTWKPTVGSVTDDETVAKQMEKLLSANSAYVDQARQRAIQIANSRGLQNSTLAARSGEEAAISQALPIAQQDASTYLNQSQRNQTAQNAAGSQNAQMGFSTRQLGEQARQFDTDVDYKNRSLLEQARQFDTGVTLEDKKLSETQRQFDNSQQMENIKLAESARQFNNDQLAKLSMFNRDTASREQIAALDAATKTYLAKVEAQYKNELQSSASAAEMWKIYQDSVTKILGNKDLDAGNKQAALDLLGTNLKEGMAVIGHVSGLDLSNLLTFTGTNTPSVPNASTPAGGGGSISQPVQNTVNQLQQSGVQVQNPQSFNPQTAVPDDRNNPPGPNWYWNNMLGKWEPYRPGGVINGDGGDGGYYITGGGGDGGGA